VDNKRREKRFAEENRVIIQFANDRKDSSNNSGINASTHDISLGGARILTPKYFPADTVIRIQINLSRSSQVVRLDGKVKWIKKIDDDDKELFEIGMEFLHKTSNTVLSLIRHLYGEDVGIPSYVS
jgi:Tfp pilus assembly protein PilZ